MPDLGPRAAYIWSCYGVTLVVLAGLITWLVTDGWKQQRLLRDLEARGVKRRARR